MSTSSDILQGLSSSIFDNEAKDSSAGIVKPIRDYVKQEVKDLKS